MRVLYLDCFSGISGDMFVGAMLDLGVSFDELKTELAKLNLEGFEIEASRVDRSGISATKFDVIQTGSHANQTHSHSHGHSQSDSHSHAHRGLSEIERLIEGSRLKGSVKERALGIFRKLGAAEAKIHNVDVETIHFHEVGAIDSIIDIVGASVCLDLLGVERIEVSHLKLGQGTFKCAHGVYPVPGPATAEILKGIPTFAGDIEGELVTPTGAAIVATVASAFGPQPSLKVQSIGYGAGTRDISGYPNVLRAMVGESLAANPFEQMADQVVVIETNIDDMNPQLYGHVMDQLFAAGALDVLITPVQMKKNRPGHVLTIIAQPADRELLMSTLFAETTTLGCRWRTEERQTLKREHIQVSTRFGKIRIKLGFRPDGTIQGFTPEFEDCREAALRSGVSLKEIQSEAISAYLEQSTTLKA